MACGLGADVYAPGAKAHQSRGSSATLRRDPEVGTVFHWVNAVISLVQTFIEGAYHGSGHARRQLYLEEFTYRFNRWHMGTGIASRLLLACIHAGPGIRLCP